MILAAQNFRDEEYVDSRAVFEGKDAIVITSSIRNIAVGRFGLEVPIDILLNQVCVKDFDAVFWVGGGGCLDFLTNTDAKRIAGEFLLEEKVIGAICAAPRLLLQWNLLVSKKMTGWNGDSALETLSIQNNTVYTGKDIEVDGKILTADGPASAKKAGERFMELLNENSKK